MDRTAAELRYLAAKNGDAAQSRRLLAIAMVLDAEARFKHFGQLSVMHDVSDSDERES
jgi:hypothetical protein